MSLDNLLAERSDHLRAKLPQLSDEAKVVERQLAAVKPNDEGEQLKLDLGQPKRKVPKWVGKSINS